jgi:hypothetical protein
MKRVRSIKITLGVKPEILGYILWFHRSFRTYFSILPKNINENGDQVFSFSFYQRENIGILKYFSPDFTINTIHVSYGNKREA